MIVAVQGVEVGCKTFLKTIKIWCPRWNASWYRFFTDVGGSGVPSWDRKSTQDRSDCRSVAWRGALARRDSRRDVAWHGVMWRDVAWKAYKACTHAWSARSRGFALLTGVDSPGRPGPLEPRRSSESYCDVLAFLVSFIFSPLSRLDRFRFHVPSQMNSQNH